MALENGIINLADMQEKINMSKREKILADHPYSVWEDKDNIWHTYLPDPSKNNGRVHRKRRSKEAINNCIIDFLFRTRGCGEREGKRRL